MRNYDSFVNIECVHYIKSCIDRCIDEVSSPLQETFLVSWSSLRKRFGHFYETGDPTVFTCDTSS